MKIFSHRKDLIMRTTFTQLPSGQWAINIPTTEHSCDLAPNTPVLVHRADTSEVEARCGKHLGHRLYGGQLSCLYEVRGKSRVVKAAPKAKTLKDYWEESA
jgi:hypothetical protein